MDESIAILRLCSHDWDGLVVHALHDGDWVEAWEMAMSIEGDYTAFAHLETVMLGTPARRTLIATNTARVVEAANGSRSSSCRLATTTIACRRATATPLSSPAARSRDRRDLGRASLGGADAGSAPSRTR